jgi:hypothetical protein
MGSRSFGCPFSVSVYIPGMRITPLLLACALIACAKSPAPSISPGPGSPSRQVRVEPTASPPPPSFVRTTAEAPSMRTVDVRDGLTHQQAMRILTDALSQRFTVDVVDPRAGFAMTTWQASLMREGAPDLRYRSRITARFIGDEWRSLQVHSDARWSRGEEADVGYDVAQLDSVAADLRVKLGRKP